MGSFPETYHDSSNLGGNPFTALTYPIMPHVLALLLTVPVNGDSV